MWFNYVIRFFTDFIVAVVIYVIVAVGFRIVVKEKEKQELIEKMNRTLPNDFVLDKMIEFEDLKFALDVTNKKFAVSSDISEAYCFVDFDKIIDYSLLVDKNVVYSAKGNVSGDLLFGGIGDINGNNTSQSYKTKKSIRSLIVRLNVDDVSKSAVDIVVVDRKIKNKEEEYTKAFQVAEEIYSAIDLVIKSKN